MLFRSSLHPGIKSIHVLVRFRKCNINNIEWQDWLTDLEENLPETVDKENIPSRKINFSLTFPQCIHSLEIRKEKILKALYR